MILFLLEKSSAIRKLSFTPSLNLSKTNNDANIVKTGN